MAERIDKWLWAIRAFKTRSEAADACKSGRISVNGSTSKPSHDVRVGEVIGVRRGAVTFRYKVLAEVNNRQPAKDVPTYAENVTPQEELDKLNAPRETFFVYREKGTGRPTKKERRQLDSLYEDFDDENA